MSAGEMDDQCDTASAVVADGRSKRGYPKTHVNYWKTRLERRTYTYDGKTFEIHEWSVRIHFKGVRKSFDLNTANKEEAAVKARDLYMSLLAKGWSATISQLNPQATQPTEIGSHSPSVGEFLAEVERTSSLKPKTLRQYAQALRRFAAYVRGVKSDASRYDYRKGGLTAWRKQIDVTPLSAITPAAVADWKIAYLRRAGTDPRRKLQLHRSFNSWLRNTKSLFSEQIVSKPGL